MPARSGIFAGHRVPGFQPRPSVACIQLSFQGYNRPIHLFFHPPTVKEFMKKNGFHGAVNQISGLPRIRRSEAPKIDVINSNIDVKLLLTALTALKRGDFSARLPLDWNGTAGKIADAFNDVTERNEKMATELERMSRVVG
jgi:hypothetical protein